MGTASLRTRDRLTFEWPGRLLMPRSFLEMVRARALEVAATERSRPAGLVTELSLLHAVRGGYGQIDDDPGEVNVMDNNHPAASARREFLKKCGKYAAVTPPTIALMLSSAEQSYAQAISGGGFPPGHHGGGHGRGDGWFGHHHDRDGHDGRGHYSHGRGNGHFDRGHDKRHRS